MAGRWTFVLVIALACAMVTAQPSSSGFLTATTNPARALEEGIVLEMGERLKITCTDRTEPEGGVLVGQDGKNFEVALDATGKVEVLGKERACVGRRGIVLNKGDRLMFTGTEGTEFDGFEGKFGVLGAYNRDKYGFEIDLEPQGKGKVYVKGAYLVKVAAPATAPPAPLAPPSKEPKKN